jgi:hypothetical protein
MVAVHLFCNYQARIFKKSEFSEFAIILSSLIDYEVLSVWAANTRLECQAAGEDQTMVIAMVA